MGALLHDGEDFAHASRLLNSYIFPLDLRELATSGRQSRHKPLVVYRSREAGFVQQGLYSVQGPGQLATDLEERMSDPLKSAQLLDLIRSVEQEMTLLGVSSHLVVVATK